MHKMKKYIYPLAFSAIFMILLQVLTVTVESVLDNGSYAGIAWIVLFLGFWVFVAVPVYCAKYSKVVHKEKYKYLFVVYSSLVLPLLHFRLHRIGIIFFFWVLGLTALFLVLRARSENKQITEVKRDEKDRARQI